MNRISHMLSLNGFAELDSAFSGGLSPNQAFAVTCRLASQLGFEHVIHAPVRNHTDARKNWAATSYPLAWREAYIAKKYLLRNPVRHKAAISSVPFLWSGLERGLLLPEREIFDDCRATGMKDGFVVPVHGAWGQTVAIGFACQSLDAISGPGQMALQALAYKLHYIFDTQRPEMPVKITPREKDVLLLLAQGLLTPAIADRLTLSENSVEWHLKNIYRKLQVGNRTAAVVCALQNGLLDS